MLNPESQRLILNGLTATHLPFVKIISVVMAELPALVEHKVMEKHKNRRAKAF
jgi:hypothetical protein